MAVQCPYNELELLISLGAAAKKLEAYEEKNGKDSVTKKLDESGLSSPPDKQLNQEVANFHGVSLETLVNSPNYSKLKDEYGEHKLKQLLEFFESEFGLDNKEGWSLLAQSLGRGQ